MEPTVRAWIRDWFERRNPELAIQDEVDFYLRGYVDSFGIIELIEEVEEHFAVRFEDEEFRQPSFRTIGGVARLVARKLAPPAEVGRGGEP